MKIPLALLAAFRVGGVARFDQLVIAPRPPGLARKSTDNRIEFSAHASAAFSVVAVYIIFCGASPEQRY